MTIPKRMRTLVGSLVAVAFVAGMFAGIAGDRLMGDRFFHPMTAGDIRVRAPDMSAVLDRLGLTPAQRRQADAIVAASAPRSAAVMLELGEHLRSVADSVDGELRAILTPAQRQLLDSLKSGSRLMLRRKRITPQGVTVDTLLDSSAAPQRPR